MASASASPPAASPSHPNPNPSPDKADPRSDPPMPDAGGTSNCASPASPEKREEEEGEEAEAAPGKAAKRAAPPPAEEEQPTPRKTRLPRACNNKPKPPPPPPPERPRRRAAAAAAGGGGAEDTPQCRVVTPLVSEPEAPAELPRWRLRCMWELGSVLNFLHVFRPLLNITAEFTAEELEAALITPNEILDDVHMPLLKSIPPVTRMAMGRGTWVTVLCRKLKDWWHWVAEGDLPIVASHGTEIETYKTLEPPTRLVILKAICDIRVEQEDIRNFIDSSLKHGHDLSTFRKERIGGDSLGISYWYEDDEILGHRMYREIRRVEQVKKEPGKRSRGKGGSSAIAVVSYQWETVASNFDEFDDVAKKERLLKKQQREALLLDSYLTSDGLTTGRSLRDRKPVTYTFDDFDRSINEAIKITKKREENSAEPVTTTTTTTNRRVLPLRSEAPSNGKLNGPSPTTNDSFDGNSSKSDDYRDSDGEQENEALDRSNRRRKRSQRYTQDFVEAVSDIDPNFDSDDDIMGEAVYDEEYLRNRKQQKASSASEEDEEFRLEEDAEDDDEEEEEYSLSTSEDIEEPQRQKKLETRARGRRGTKLRSVDEIDSGLRRSKRSSRPRINYRQYDYSDSDTEPGKARKSDASDPDAGSDAENDMELSTSSQEQEEEEEDDSPDEQNGNNVSDKMEEDHAVAENKVEPDEEQQEQPQQQPVEKIDAPSRENESVGRTFLDLNELAPGGFDDGPSLTVKDDMDNS
ncbi:DDT domain-containing protein DDR4 [Dichanthelium oligosanthes]|uniref:DDT domain-containing protein DDR4 n=1 Tax=Dichanthelium oligosanthes TaxID=888268 RepID=A0A1E5VEQ1_9POAL|nr:DDT domain-containing protein DDR4 [Dichanthelium oligosanthes]